MNQLGAVLCLITQLCLTLCDPMDCSLLGSSVRGDSPGKNTGVGCHALLQGTFPTQGSNPGLPQCRRILYQLSYQGSLNQLYMNINPLFFILFYVVIILYHLSHQGALYRSLQTRVEFLCVTHRSLLVIHFTCSAAYTSVSIFQCYFTIMYSDSIRDQSKNH